MFGKRSTERVAELFFLRPRKVRHLRELSRESGLSVSTVSSAVEELEKEGLLKVEKNVTKEIEATKNREFRDLKRAYNLRRLAETGLIDEVEKQHRPDTLVLFGSYSKGEDDETSDIDLAAVNGKETSPDLSGYEELLERKINVQEVRLEEAGENFKATLANGVVLRGYLDL